MGSEAFLLLISSLIATHATSSRLLDSPDEASDTSPFAECNPFNYQAKGITSCEEYFQKFPLNIEACDLNLAWHDICFGAVPEGKGSLREICPDECGSKVLDPELENEDALAVQNFIDFLENYEEDELKDGRRNLGAPTCNEGFQDVTNGNAYRWYCGRHCPGGRYWTDYYCNCACEPLPVYTKSGYSQCFTHYTPYPGDRMDNPIFNGGGFIGVMTGSECEARCNSDYDPYGRPCVAFEHSSQNYDAPANCALAWACDYTQSWSGGAVYSKYSSNDIYSKIGYSQCFTRSTPYPGDRVDNPIFNGGGFIGVMTGSQCEARCNSDHDPYGRPCVAFEHSSQNYHASANCALAWACDYTRGWNGGAVYMRN